MKKKRPVSVYKAVWRWHFYAGMIAGPIILAVTITGLIYIWVDEWETTVNRDLFIAQPATGEPAPLDDQVKAVLEKYPEADLERFLLRGGDLTSQMWWKTEEGFTRYVYINPYTAEVQGTRNHQRSFMPIMRKMHRTLLMGRTGRILIELATSWTLVLLLTGLVLWWPKQINRVMGVWWIRLKRVKPYIVWRDLHTVPNMYISLIAIIIVFTGLFYTLVSGTLMKLSVLATTDLFDKLRNPPAVSTAEPVQPLSRQRILEAVRTVTDQPKMVFLAPETSHPDDPEKHLTPDHYDPEKPVHFARPWLVHLGNKNDPTTQMYLHIDPYNAEILQTIR
ncbi:MAG: PepSY domain-containing protein, partial [Verrucomicrobiota bacterium]